MIDVSTGRNRPLRIDIMAMRDYGFDSDEVDEIEADCIKRGVTLVTEADWRIQFDLEQSKREAFGQ
jgi:hypothetical protein